MSRPATLPPWATLGALAARVTHEKADGIAFRALDTSHDEMVTYAEGEPWGSACHFNDDRWNGNKSEAEVRAYLRDGDMESAAEAEKLLGDLVLDVESETWQPAPAPVGFSPRIGAYLAGDPHDMWFRRRDQDAGGPIRIYVSIVSSGNVTDQQLRVRGTAAIAVALALARVRPVEVVAMCATQVCGNVNTTVSSFHAVAISPVDLGRIGAWLGRCCIARNVGYQMARDIAGEPNADSLKWPALSEAKLCAWHAARDNVAHVLIPAPYAQAMSVLLADPRAWCEQQLKLALVGQGEGHTVHNNRD